MDISGPLVRGTFLSRPNRFLGIVRIRGVETCCFVPNPGRLKELLRPGTTIWLRENASGERKTRWDLALARHGNILVSVDTRVVNRILPEAIQSGFIPSLAGLWLVRAEYPFLDSRLDFLAQDGEGPVLMEAKSCTLMEAGVARFPDAPTARGRRHLGNLAEGVRRGMKAMVIFVIQREDGETFIPNATLDPEFCRAFREALSAGVQACAFTCRVGMNEITPYQEVPVAFP